MARGGAESVGPNSTTPARALHVSPPELEPEDDFKANLNAADDKTSTAPSSQSQGATKSAGSEKPARERKEEENGVRAQQGAGERARERSCGEVGTP